PDPAILPVCILAWFPPVFPLFPWFPVLTLFPFAPAFPAPAALPAPAPPWPSRPDKFPALFPAPAPAAPPAAPSPCAPLPCAAPSPLSNDLIASAFGLPLFTDARRFWSLLAAC